MANNKRSTCVTCIEPPDDKEHDTEEGGREEKGFTSFGVAKAVNGVLKVAPASTSASGGDEKANNIPEGVA